jgi:prepilin-type N-terminal cleavage/methylation domain-containing protein
MKNNKGFTLIEMLVVIAIIGLLSSVVLVALGPSRNKAKDARIISDVNQVQALMEASFTNGSYGTPDIATLSNDVKANNGNTAGIVVNGQGTSAFAAYAQLTSDATKYYCVDSTGANHTGASPATATVCPGN